MTPEELDAALTRIGWTQRQLAYELQVHHSKVQRWITGRYPVPETLAAWLTRLARCHEKHPLPLGWDQ